MMGLSERRLRVRATYIANLMQSGKLNSNDPKLLTLSDERFALSGYLELIKEPIDPAKTRGKVV